MFSSKPKDAAPAPAPMSAPAAPIMPSRKAARSAAPSILSADAVITGTLVSTGDMQIDGRVEGDVHSTSLVIGDKAEIHGEVIAEDVTVRGRVIGRIRARKVLLCATSHVEGDILHEAFAVESGAFFEGNCRHAENPLADEASTRKPAAAIATPTAASQPAAPTSTLGARPGGAETNRPLAAS
jgi:cytoskeletal protein CcmA (bactofilin family)